MAENFVNILREIRGNTLAPATDTDCIYGDIKWMYGVISGYRQITPEERLKLENIEEGATKNSTDAFLLSRANHTGTQSADTIVNGITNAAFTNVEKRKLAALDTTKPSAHFHDNETISSLSYSKLIDVPASFNPSKHLHNMNEITLGNLDASRITESSDKQFVSST